MPGGAFYAFPNVSAHLRMERGKRLPKDTTELAKLLLDKARVALVPGDAFGAPRIFAPVVRHIHRTHRRRSSDGSIVFSRGPKPRPDFVKPAPQRIEPEFQSAHLGRAFACSDLS